VNEPSLFAFNRKAKCNEFSTSDEDGIFILETSRLKLVYKPDGKPFSAENIRIIVKNGNSPIRWVPGMKNKKNLGGTLRTVDGVSGKIDLGEGVLSRDGWYLHDDSHRPLLSGNWVKSRPKGAGTDWYFFAYGNDFKAALKSLTAIGGKIPLPRKYVLGSWYSRYWPYSESDYKQIVNEFKSHDFPLDNIVLDMDWHKDGWTGWSWNRKLLPGPQELLKWFHDQNLYTTINLHPATGVAPHEDQYKPFMEALGQNIKGIPDSTFPTLTFDASDKKYMDALSSKVLGPLKETGVDFWWLDWQQYEFTKGMPDLKNLEWLNHFLYQNTSENNMRGQSFSRWGGWGDHRYPIHFSGDAVAVWPMLAFEVPFTSTAGNVGCFFWSHDIGGHYGNFDQETNTRWVQFGAASAALRLHSTRDANMDKRPWKFSPNYTNSMKIAFHLRSELFPYIYSNVWLSTSESQPLICPMYIEYPEKEIAYNCSQQYLFGTSILVAPITSPGSGPEKVTFQNIWFPKGNWYNLLTNEKYQASDNFQAVWADINEFPIYAKGGVPIPMQPYKQRMAMSKLDTLVVRVYPGIDGEKATYTLYEDDGVTSLYENGKFATTEMAYARKGNSYEVKIEGTNGKYRGQLKYRCYLIEFPCTQKTSEVLINGQKAEINYNSELSMNIVSIGISKISKPFTISLTAPEIDYNALTAVNFERRKKGLIDSSLITKTVSEILTAYSKKDNINDFMNALGFLTGVSIKFDDDLLSITKNKGCTFDEISLNLYDTNGKEKKDVAVLKIDKQSQDFQSSDIKMKPIGFGMKTTRNLEISTIIEKKKTNIKVAVKSILPSVPAWKTVGPFAYDITKNIAECIQKPETENKIDTTEILDGQEGKKISWQTVIARTDGVTDLFEIFKTMNSVGYAVTYIFSDVDQNITFRIISDDGNEVFLNNRKIFSNNVFRALNGPEDVVKGKLKKGLNTLMVKISQAGGGWEFRVNIDTEKSVKISTNPKSF
jgi:alpha-glucosidase (family GH31 glycosyl hydrolase)